jgi:hypothetical protein
LAASFIIRWFTTGGSVNPVIAPEAKEFLDTVAHFLEVGGWKQSYRYGRQAHDVWTQAEDRFSISKVWFNTKEFPSSVKARFYHSDLSFSSDIQVALFAGLPSGVACFVVVTPGKSQDTDPGVPGMSS